MLLQTGASREAPVFFSEGRTMKTIQILAGLVLAITFAPNANGQNNELNWTMERAVSQLDRQGSDLESVLAEVDVDWTGQAQGADRIRSGRIYINERGEFRISVEMPKKRTVLLEGNTLHFYDAEAATVDEYSLNRHKNRLEVYIPVGFSTTGKDLEDDFLVTFIGEETIGDRRTLGLELTPKRDNVREVVSKIQVWFDEASWLPARQIISSSAGGATLTVNYKGTARNLDLNPKLFDDNWPRGTKKNSVRE
jgi:outer membrane lipoprotein-sorting protein